MKLTTRQLTLCAVLTAMALALSYLENFFPLSLAIPIPGIKLGLANIVTLFALYALGPGQALLILLAGQTLLMFVFAYFIVFRVMGRDYDAAVISSGVCGFGMGATPNAMANMQALCEKYAPSVKAYLLIPLVGSLFADFINSLVTTFFINFI
jgi:sodium--glutamate symport carrier gltS